MAREIGPVAEILAGAQEEHLYAHLAAVGVGGKDVGFLDRRQADRLMRLDLRQRANAVTQYRGAFELQTGGCLLHALRQRLLDLAVAPAQEAAHLVDDRRVLVLLDAPHAWRRAALDLVLKARSGARREYPIGAGTQRKSAL